MSNIDKNTLTTIVDGILKDLNDNGAVIAAVIVANPSGIVQMVTRSGSYNIFKSGIRQLLRKNGGGKLGIK